MRALLPPAIRAPLVALACLVGVAPAAAPAAEPPAGLIRLSREMIDLLGRVEGKLAADQEAWRQGWGKIVEGIELEIENNVAARYLFQQAGLVLGLEDAWRRPELRRAALLHLGELALALEDEAAARKAEIHALEARRRAALAGLLQSIGQIRANQEELLAYLEDRSPRKKLGELDIALIAATVAQARELRRALAEEPELGAKAVAAEEKRVADSLEALRDLLRELPSSRNEP